jgi:hypothetical protein
MTWNGLFYVYLAGVIYFTLAMGHQRKSKPQNFFVDFLTVFLILLWPIMFAWGLWCNEREKAAKRR